MKISIIIPVAPQFQHAEKYLKRCLASILWQLEDEDEVIIEGAGNHDESWQKAADSKDGHQRIIWLGEKPNRGISASRNRAIWECSGDWIKFMDCDDMLAPYALSTFRSLAIPDSIQLVAGPQIKVVNGKLQGLSPRPPLSDIKVRNPTLPSMTFVRRAALMAVDGFRENIHFEEDWDLWLRLEEKFGLNSLASVSWPVCYYWIDEQERLFKTADHTVEYSGKRMDVREYFKRVYGCKPE